MVNKNNLCNNKEESTDHILIHYNKTRELWTFLLALFGLVWVFPTSMIDLLLQWKVRVLQKKKMAVWLQFVYFGVFGKNTTDWRTFKDKQLSDQSLKDIFIWTLFEWSRDSLELENPSLLNFLDALYCS